MKEQTREEPRILAAAERQMRTWVLTAEIEDRVIRAEGPHRLAESVQEYVTISREEGAGGSEIAQAVGQRLGWKVLDKNLLDHVAERCRVSRGMLELVDETESNWVYDVLGTWMDRRIVTHDKYVAHLCHVVLAGVRHAHLVLVGRGAQFLLPRDRGLAVRIIAPQKYRVEQIMERDGVSCVQARQFIDEADRGRREFVQRYFHQDIDDPHLYDLVINVEQIGRAAAVEQIIAGLGQ